MIPNDKSKILTQPLYPIQPKHNLEILVSEYCCVLGTVLGAKDTRDEQNLTSQVSGGNHYKLKKQIPQSIDGKKKWKILLVMILSFVPMQKTGNI